MSAKLKIDPYHAAIMLDVSGTGKTGYRGIDIAYRTYMKTGSVVLPLSSKGTIVYTLEGSEVLEEDAKLRKKAEKYVFALTVSVTGAREGEIITGVRPKMTQGAVIRIADGIAPPSADDLDAIRSFPDLWKRFIDKLATLDFFANLSDVQRAVWLSDHERVGEYDIADAPVVKGISETYMQIFDVGKSKLLSIEGDVLNELLTGNDIRIDGAWKGSAIRNLLPKKPGTKPKRHTYIFYAHYWKVSASYKESDHFDGPVYDTSLREFVYADPSDKVFILDGLAASYVLKKKTTQKARRYEVGSKQDIGLFDLANANRQIPKYFDILIDVFGETQDDINTIVAGCKNFTAATYKSLLQKLVRYAAIDVRVGGEDKIINSKTVLRVVFTLLLTHPGGFLPDIKRFVSGQESALKRLMITIIEDSYHPNPRDLLHLAMLSLLSQRIVGWKLGEKDFIFAIGMCDAGLEERATFKHGIAEGLTLEPYVVSADPTNPKLTWQNISAILDEVKSFETDEAMVRYIAKVGGTVIKNQNDVLERPKVMDLFHCIDQHSAPEIAYLLPVHIVERFRGGTKDAPIRGSPSAKGTKGAKDKGYGSEPYWGLFKTIFRNITGVNSRRKTTGLSGHMPMGQQDFYEAVKNAQKLVLLAKQHDPLPFPTTPISTHHVSWKMDRSWIAGLVGPIFVPGKPPAMVTMKPDDPYQMVAIRRPARGMKDDDAILSDERIEEAISAAHRHLSVTGASLNVAHAPVDWLSKYILKLDMTTEEPKLVFYDPPHPRTLYEWKDIECVEDDVNVYRPPWTDGRSILGGTQGKSRIGDEKMGPKNNELNLPIPGIPTWNDVLTHGGTDGIVENAGYLLGEILKKYNITTIRRALSYIASNRANIEVARLSKSGGGTAQAVILEDVGAYQILLYISGLYPKAMQRESGYVSKFIIKYAPLMAEVKSILRNAIIQSPGVLPLVPGMKTETEWGHIEDTTTRIPYAYQDDTVNEMKEKREAGKKGHFIWIPGGMGKTMIVLSYLKDLIDSGKAPKYVVYTLPSSAIKSIFTELGYFGFWINYMRPIGEWKKAPFTAEYSSEAGHDTMLEGYINVIEHDDLRKAQDELVSKASDSIFIIDEVHKALNDSKRTDTALSISRLSIDFIAMTGTPIVDTNTYKLIWWLEQIVEFEVNDKNFWVAANGMIAKKVNTGVLVHRKDVVAEMTAGEIKKYHSLVPKAMGGTNTRPSDKDIREAFDISYQPCDREMVRQALEYFDDGVMMVSRSVAHQATLKSLLIKAGVAEDDVYALGSGESIFMTDEAVEAGDIPDYKIVIVTKRQAEGYTLTRMRTFITSVYPSNNATREQLELRINRISQHAEEITYITIHSGILTYVLQRHKDAASISAVLSAIAKEI